MKAVRFIHLNCHSAFSLLEGALPISNLIACASADGMPAVGVTDTANLFGALEFSEKAAESGLQPIVGCKLPVSFSPSENGDEGRDPRRQVQPAGALEWMQFLCATEDGYRNLVNLVTGFYLSERGRGEPLTIDRLSLHGNGLIALTGGHDGVLYRCCAENETSKVRSRLSSLSRVFGDRLYVNVERHGMGLEERGEQAVLAAAYAAGLPVVATNEPFFPARTDYDAHDALLAVADGRVVSDDDRRRLTPKHDFASQDEMAERFGDLPEALDMSVEIALRCHFRPTTISPILPRFAAGAEGSEPAAGAEAAELRQQAVDGLKARLAVHGCAPGLGEEDYYSRLDFELDVIERMEYPGYFLIVADFIKWAKGEKIPVGPGRGSGAGSVVAWALTITDLDPLRFALLFERFLNPERVSMPDFDIDFCQERRDEVIGYVQRRYGADQVAQIITFGTLQARAALRDVGRVLEMPYGQVDRLCKMVPADPANPVSLAEAIAGEPRFDEARKAEPVVGRLLDIATRLEGLYRHASTHAAGIVIGDRPLQELVPLYRDPRSDLPVTQFNMKWVEQAGLVKFDFLGLKTLSVLEKTVEHIRGRGADVDLQALPLDDEKTFAMLARGETVGVFQVESQGMRRALVGMKADRFEDIIALVALYRPGPMDNIPTYNRRKHREEDPDYLHPLLEPILKETYGVIIYQEQVMQIAQVLSGYSLGEADLLRRAMGKKIKAEMDAQRQRFVDGAVAKDVRKSDAVMVFDLVAKFASYGFNKSHAAAYALVAYQTAYLKANYPVEFLAASMTLDLGNTDKLNEFRHDAERIGIEVMAPDINRSGSVFQVADNAIVYALTALKGVGAQVVEHIVLVRGGRPFRDLSDFAARIDPAIVTRRALECLVQAGAFDSLVPDRATVFQSIGKIIAAAQERVQRAESGVGDLFGEISDVNEVVLQTADAWDPAETLHREFQAVGAYLSAHPIDQYREMIEGRGGITWKAFAEQVRQHHLRAGLIGATIVQKQERRTRTGGRMGILNLSDPTGQFEATVYQERLAEWRDRLEPGTSYLIRVSGEFDMDTEDIRTRVMGIELLEDVAAQSTGDLCIFIDGMEPVGHVAQRLEGDGDGEVRFVCLLPDRKQEVEIQLPGRFRVTPAVAGAIKSVPGVIDIRHGSHTSRFQN